MRTVAPRGYVCGRAKSPITIDGKGDEPAWADAPWTEDFVDIEGSRRPAPRFRTHAKMLWDDQNLYIHAELEEPHVWGTITKKNEVIFADNDFEVFIDPDSDNHNYYEFEMNALNTIWELTLVKPYRDGGPVKNETNIKGLKHGRACQRHASMIPQTRTNLVGRDRDSMEGAGAICREAACPPKDGDQWRMDFSRVEWLVDIIDGKYRKMPKEMSPRTTGSGRRRAWSTCTVRSGGDMCSFPLQPPGVAKFKPDPTLAARDRLMEVYHRQREYQKRFGKYAATTEELGMAKEAATGSEPDSIDPKSDGYIATAHLKLANGSTHTLHVSQDSRLWEE